MNRKPIGLWFVVAMYCFSLYSNSKFTYQLIFDLSSLARNIQTLYAQMPFVIYIVYIAMSICYAIGIFGLISRRKYGFYSVLTAFGLNLGAGLYSIFVKNSLDIYMVKTI